GLLVIVPLYVGLVGFELGGVRYTGQWVIDTPAGCHPFFALRPLTEGELVLAKLRVAARCTLITWALVLAAVGLTFGLTGAWRVLAAAPLLQPYSAWEVWAGLTAGL